MKTMGKRLSWIKWASGVLLALVLLGSGLFTNVAAAQAVSPATAQDGTLLERAYRRLVWALEGQSMSLDLAADVAGRVEGWIESLRERGEDVTELESALAAYRAATAEAQTYHDQAAAILLEHAGFDRDGQVTDREQARQTLREAGRLLRDARRTLTDGSTTLRRTIVDWREEHRRRGGAPDVAGLPRPRYGSDQLSSDWRKGTLLGTVASTLARIAPRPVLPGE